MNLDRGSDGVAQHERDALASAESGASTELTQPSVKASGESDRYSWLFESTDQGIVYQNAAGEILDANPAAARLLGVTQVQPGGPTTLDPRWRAVREDGSDFPHEELPAMVALHTGQPVRGVVMGVYAPDEGTYRWLRVSATPRFRAGEARPWQVYTTFDDITVTGAPQFDVERRMTGGGCAGRDVTESRSASREAAERVAQLEAIFEVMTDAVFLYSADGHIREANRAGRLLVGMGGEAAHLQRSSEERVARYRLRDEHGRPLPQSEWPVQRVLRGEHLTGDGVSEFVIDTLDGRTVDLSFSGAPVVDGAGQLTGAVGVLRDVTLTRQRDRQNRMARTALLQIASAVTDPSLNSDPMKLLPALAQQLCTLDAVDTGFAMLIDEHNFLEPLALCGATSAQAAAWGADVRRFDPTDPRVAPRVADARALLDAGRPLVQVFDADDKDMDEPLMTPGTVQSLHIRASITVPVQVGGRLIGMLNVGRSRPPEQNLSSELRGVGGFAAWDVELMEGVGRLAGEVLGRAALSAQLTTTEAARLAAEEATRQRDEFLGIAGHEMRTPMTSSRANVQLAERSVARALAAMADGESPLRHLEQVQVLLKRTLTQIDRQARLVDDLLDVSRIQEGRLDLRLARFNLAAVLCDVVDEQRLAHSDRMIHLLLDADVATLFADPDRIGQVVTNYLTNALKYSPTDTPVTVRLTTTAEYARVAVTDQGPGLSLAQQSHLWERFQRVQGIEVQSGSGIGLGLGLYICRELIERHDGQFGVESVPGEGSTFWFTVPLARSDGRAEEHDSPAV